MPQLTTNITNFYFFENTPLTDMQNTIHFSDNNERDDFFDSEFNTIEAEHEGLNRYNFISNKSSIDVNIEYNKLRFCNYGYFKSRTRTEIGEDTYTYENLENYESRMYFFINEIEYISDYTTRVHFLLDDIMNFTQGTEWINKITGNVNIERTHLNENEYNRLLTYLRTNDDVLNVATKRYFHDDLLEFTKETSVIFQCSADLSKDFGTEKNPKMPASTGLTFDNMTSPIDLYFCEDLKEFLSINRQLSDYPWIAQNISNIMLFPKLFTNNLKYDEKQNEAISDLVVKKIAHLTTSDINPYNDESSLKNITYSVSELMELLNLKENEKHLLRNHYHTLEINTFNGKVTPIDLSQISMRYGINWGVKSVLGYDNQVVFYIRNYKANDDNDASLNPKIDRGSFLNDAIYFNNFDEVPIMIDNYKLNLAKNAHQRELAESKLVTNRIKNILDPKADLKTRLMDGLNLVSGITNFSNVLGKFTDEYEFYRSQKAEFQDMALNSNSVTNQNTSNAFARKNEIYGINLKFSSIDKNELEKVRLYHNKFGFDVSNFYQKIEAFMIESMENVNFLKLDGYWNLEQVDVNTMDILRIRFMNGIFFWHYNSIRENGIFTNLEKNEWR